MRPDLQKPIRRLHPRYHSDLVTVLNARQWQAKRPTSSLALKHLLRQLMSPRSYNPFVVAIIFRHRFSTRALPR